MEEELIDKYERWEERLQQKEDSLNQRKEFIYGRKYNFSRR